MRASCSASAPGDPVIVRRAARHGLTLEDGSLGGQGLRSVALLVRECKTTIGFLQVWFAEPNIDDHTKPYARFARVDVATCIGGYGWP